MQGAERRLGNHRREARDPPLKSRARPSFPGR